MPAAVRRKIDATKGKGTLLEEDELERLEKEGYRAGQETENAANGEGIRRRPVVDAAPDITEDPVARRLREEEERFAREMEMVEEQGEPDTETKGVEMEEISDED